MPTRFEVAFKAAVVPDVVWNTLDLLVVREERHRGSDELNPDLWVYLKLPAHGILDPLSELRKRVLAVANLPVCLLYLSPAVIRPGRSVERLPWGRA